MVVKLRDQIELLDHSVDGLGHTFVAGVLAKAMVNLRCFLFEGWLS